MVNLQKDSVNKNTIPLQIHEIQRQKLNRYLGSEKFLEQTLSLKKLVRIVTNGKLVILDRIWSLFIFTIQQFTYCYPIERRGIKNLDLHNLKGDCGEYSSLFVTMCRILKVPAINKTGFVIFSNQRQLVEHEWAQIYIKPFGWIDMDTQYASLERKSSDYKIFFGKRQDYRIAFTNGYNIPLKFQLPLNNIISRYKNIAPHSVQTLQPLTFASKFETKLIESIKQKKSYVELQPI